MIDEGRRFALRAAKLRALVRQIDPGATAQQHEVDFGIGVALTTGGVGYALVEDSGHRGIGRVLAWADRTGVSGAVHVLVEGAASAGVLARRSQLFTQPPQVWLIDGATVAPAVPAAYEARIEPSGAALAAAEPMAAAGAELVIEFGVVTGEVKGLEIGRVVERDGDWILEVGVGKNDRAAASMMESLRPKAVMLADVVATVAAQRRPDASPHLLNRLARERWLRATIVANPRRVGAAALVAIEAPTPRLNLVDTMPALAVGTDVTGEPLVVGCSVGIDLDLAAIAADGRSRWCEALGHHHARLILVMPSRDRYSLHDTASQRLCSPAEIVTVDGDWPQ